MMRLFRNVGLGLVALVVICVSAIALLAFQADVDEVVADSVAQLEEIGGYVVEVSPDADMVYWPMPGVQISDLTVKTADGRQIIQSPEALLGVSYQALLGGEITAGSISLRSAQIDVSMEEFRRLLQGRRAGAKWGALTHFSVQDARIVVATDSDPVILESATISVDHAGPSAPITLAGTAMWEAQTFDGHATIGSLAALHGGRQASIDLMLQFEAAAAAFKGRVRLTDDAYPHVQGKGSFAAARPEALADLLGQKMPALRDVTDVNSTIDVTSLPNRLWLKAQTTGTLNGRKTSLDTTLSADAGWMESGNLQLDIVNRTGGLYSVYFNGLSNPNGQVSGVLKGAILDMPGLLAWSGHSVQPAWARVTFSSDVTVVDTGVAAQAISLTLDDLPVTGSFAADLRGNKPLISASIVTKGIDLPDLIAQGPLTAWRNHLVRTADAVTVDLSLEDTSFRGTPIERLEATVTQRGDKVIIEAPQLDLFGGSAALEITVPDQAAAPIEGSFRAAELDASAVGKAIGVRNIIGILAGDMSFSAQVKGGQYALSDVSGVISMTDGKLPIPDFTAGLQGRDRESAMAVDLLNAKLTYTNEAITFRGIDLTTSGQAWSGTAAIALDQLTIEGQMSPVRPEGQASLVTLQGPLDKIEISVQPRQVQEPPADTVAASGTSAPATPGPADSEAFPIVDQTVIPESEPDTLAQSSDQAVGDDPAEAEYSGPPAPETLRSPIPRRAPR